MLKLGFHVGVIFLFQLSLELGRYFTDLPAGVYNTPILAFHLDEYLRCRDEIYKFHSLETHIAE